MGKRHTKEEHQETLKLAEEIDAAAAARRLGINVDTLYGWRGREKERAAGTCIVKRRKQPLRLTLSKGLLFLCGSE